MPFSKLKLFLSLSLAVAFTCSAMAQNATVKVLVTPHQAYVFADGKAMGNGHRTLDLAPGKHVVAVYNYGYKPMVREVELVPGRNKDLSFALEKAGDAVSVPFGLLQIEGAPHAAVLLNGKQPEYFVGHGDEFNNHIGWKQQLLVPAGSHNVTLLYGGKELWSGKLNVPANKRVIVNAIYFDPPKITVKDWPAGAAMHSVPRFTAGRASTTVAVAPVTGSFAIEPKQINCNEPARLTWNTTEAVHTAIGSESSNFAELPAAGQQTVSPRQTTVYHFKTSGPGGVVETSETLQVNPVVQGSLTSTPEAHYLRVGDKVLRQDSATLTWNTGNADKVVLGPEEKVSATGTETLKLAPEKDAVGPVDETKSYKIVASNECGGSETKDVKVHLVGLVESMISSVFFPTAYPDSNHPDKGLLGSQQEELKRIATVFKTYLETVPDAKLNVTGMADPRGTKAYNQRLSERRVSIVKNFLVAQGIAPELITGEAKGAGSPLDEASIKQLEASNPQQPVAGRAITTRANWLAYNRRADVAIEPAAIESARFYPHQAKDSQLLYESKRVTENQIDQASASATVIATK